MQSGFYSIELIESNLLLASTSFSLGAMSHNESCSFTLGISFGCKTSNQLIPNKSRYNLPKRVNHLKHYFLICLYIKQMDKQENNRVFNPNIQTMIKKMIILLKIKNQFEK